jgi:hypothetical protein
MGNSEGSERGGECSHTTEEAIRVSQSAMSVGSICQIRVAQPSSLSQYQSDSPRTIVSDLTREIPTYVMVQNRRR